ncbi:MAG: protein kinase [Holophagaceae bacterium]|nr:protein kinase [Holophagaceae bacterium]
MSPLPALLLGAGVLRAQAADPVRHALPAFRITTSQEGLPQNSIMSLDRDPAGRIWTGTQDGAAVFNGQRWRIHNMPDRSRSNFLRRVTVDGAGDPWAARQDGGLARFRNGAWERVPEAGEGRMNDVLAQGREVFAATPDAGLRHFDGGAWRNVRVADGLPSDRVLCLARDGTGRILAGTGGGLAVFEAGRWRRDEGLPAVAVGCLWGDLAGTARGLFRRTAEGWKEVPLPAELRAQRINAAVRTRTREGREVLWVGFDNAGLASFEEGQWRSFGPAQGLPSGTVWSLLPVEGADGTRALLVGTDGGLATLEFGLWRSFGRASGLADPSVYGLCLTEGPGLPRTLWVSTRSGGVAEFQGGRWKQHGTREGLPTPTVFALLEWPEAGGRRVLLAGTQGHGIWRYDGRRWSAFPAPEGLAKNGVRVLKRDADAQGAPRLWAISGDSGVWCLEGGRWTHLGVKEGLPTEHCHALAWTTGGRETWIGTENGGLVRMRKGQVQTFSTASGFPNNTVMSLLPLKIGDREWLLAGTEGAGLVYADPSVDPPRWQVLGEDAEGGLPNNTVYQLQGDAQGRIYAFTNRGVARLTPQVQADRLAFAVETFGAEAGLPSLEFNGGASMQDAQGRIWGGSVGGAVVFDPKEEVAPPPPARISLEAFTVNGAARPPEPASRFTYRERNLAFTFALPALPQGAALRFRTQLEGLEEKAGPWSLEPRREFPGLHAGAYALRVEAVDGYGRVVAPARWRFEVLPAPWRTPWAYGLYALILGGGAWLVVRARLKHLEKVNAELEGKVRERTREVEAQRNQIAALMQSAPRAQRDLASWAQEMAMDLCQSLQAQHIGLVTVAGDLVRPLGDSSFAIPSLEQLQKSFFTEPQRERRRERQNVATDRRLEQVIPVRGSAGEILGGLVVRGHFGWGDAERKLVGSFASQLGSMLELQQARKALHQARDLQAKTREAMLAKGVEPLQLCPTCGRCYGAAETVCPQDGAELGAPRLIPRLIQDRYELRRVLGEGGMGLVFEAQDLRLDREVALKLIKPELYNMPEIRGRFQQEALALARIHHPGVIAIYDSGELEDGSAFLVMELLRGQNLGDLMRRYGAGTPRQVARLLRQGAAALGSAHRAGLLHRDIKPENFFLIPGEEGFQTKLLDFGLAKTFGAEDGLTRTGMVVGTPNYMSPDQLKGMTLDARSDLYAFATVAFEALTGHRLVQPTALADVFVAITQGDFPPPSQYVPGLPDLVDLAFKVALATDREGRPMDVEAWVGAFTDTLARIEGDRAGWPDLLTGRDGARLSTDPTSLGQASSTGKQGLPTPDANTRPNPSPEG